MQSILLVCPEKTKRDEYIQQYTQSNNINAFDVSIIKTDTTIGVETVRDMQKTAYLKPLYSENKMIIIDNAHTATIEAQNALLKIIEEPPQKTIIILSAAHNHTLLPTILSRCFIVELQADIPVVTSVQEQQLIQQLTILTSGTISDKLALAQELSEKKESILPWIYQMEAYLQHHVFEKHSDQYVQILLNLQNAADHMTTTNIQPRFILEHYFLLQ